MAYDKPAVPPPNAHYPGHKHEDMKRLVNENFNAEAATEVSDAWRTIGKQFTELSVDFNILVNGSQDGWKGQAAEGVRTALGKVGTFADSTGTTFASTADAVTQQRDTAVQANRSMPEPVEYNPMKMMKDSLTNWNPIDNLTLPFDMMEQREQSQGAKDEAVRVMQQRDNSMMASAASMPTLQSTPVVTQDQGTTQTSSTTFSNTTHSSNPNTQFGNPGVNNNGTTNTSWSAPPVTQPKTPGTPPIDTNRPTPPQQPPMGPFPIDPRTGRPFDPRTGRPIDPRTGKPIGGPAGGRPGGGPGGGAGRGGMGPGGPGGMGRNAGAFGPANPGGGTGALNNAHGPEGAAGRGGSGTTGKAGAAGAGAMGGGAGAGKGGGEDKEHKANYLIPTDEYFDDDRMVAPPVIGG